MSTGGVEMAQAISTPPVDIFVETLSGVGESRVVGKEPLRDLDCVEGGAFLDLVADNPET